MSHVSSVQGLTVDLTQVPVGRGGGSNIFASVVERLEAGLAVRPTIPLSHTLPFLLCHVHAMHLAAGLYLCCCLCDRPHNYLTVSTVDKRMSKQPAALTQCTQHVG